MRRPLVLWFALAGAGVMLSGPAASLGGAGAVKMRFACYPAQFSGFRAQPATFVDQFSRSVSLVVQVPQAVCAPAPGSSASYLTCYRVTVRRTRFLVRTRRVVDEFTKTPLAVRVSALLTLCAPSARVDAGASSPRGLDFFTCYAAKPSRVIAANGVLVADQFGSSRDAVHTPINFCAPGAKTGSQQIDRTRFLSCYVEESQTKGTTVVVKSAFGYLKAALGPRRQLCTTARLAA
jgi:hypothetical protein